MAIRRLSYRLDEEPDTGAVRLIPAPPGPQEQEQEKQQTEQPLECLELAEYVLAVGHRHGLSRSRLPGGGSLLCATDAEQRIDAVYADSVDELPPFPGDLGTEQLIAFAREHASRVEPFLADVHRLFGERAGRQIVVAEHDPETVAHWVALACASLPHAYAVSLTFSTWADAPRRAPQQIIGIGPDADFDRFHGPTLDHLYRVHDGLDGQGSSPLADTWAEVTAKEWIEGNPPEPPSDGGDPFGVTRPPLDVGKLLAMSDATRREAVQAHAETVRQEPAVSPVVDELYLLCEELGGADPAAAEPLAIALVRHYVAVAEAQETLPDIAACERLPLSTDAWQRLRAEFGERADEVLRGKVRRDPMGKWTQPLRLALALGAESGRGLQGRGLQDATERLARALLNPGRRECAEAVEVLEALGHPRLTRQVLNRLGGDLTKHKLDQLRGLANAPQGAWLLRNIDDAPLVVSIAEAAARLSREPGGPRGAELFAALTELLPGRRVNDADTLWLLWRLVWGGRQPDLADVQRVARACTARLIIDAGFAIQLTGWLRAPERIDAELIELARSLLGGNVNLRGMERATAELIVLAQDFADGEIPVEYAVGQLGDKFEQAKPLNIVLREGTGALVALGLAGVDPVELCRSPGLNFLVGADNDVLHPYRSHLLAADTRERMIQDLPHRPDRIAALYYAWRPRQGRGVTVDWQRAAEQLLTQVLAPVVPRLNEWTLGQVATEIARLSPERAHERVQEWNAWLYGQRRAQPPSYGPGPGPGPGHQHH
ncbi:GTPase-associated protein 1-related protein [Streptomyces sp. NPDC086554]|uniref:GTPase-associated protein 1-related protein n=1 Tax=Streptomyces sp. NPDC086554 TaxID=3154864 RepID=UPI003430E2A0